MTRRSLATVVLAVFFAAAAAGALLLCASTPDEQEPALIDATFVAAVALAAAITAKAVHRPVLSPSQAYAKGLRDGGRSW